ncbi:MAG: FAD-binding oxidoreductase [Chloroflexota bacterium]|nr:FAD-binding oxidoreductase [Chloroflexota bacterium]
MTASADLGRDLSGQLTELLGGDRVVPSSRVTDYTIGPFAPSAIVRPSEADQVSALLQWAHHNDIAVYPAGGRTFSHLGNTPTRPGIALDMTGLNRMVDFQPADLTVRVQAGMTVGQLDSELSQDGKCVPLAPPLAHRATIGGTLATGISGPMRSAYGLPRDWLIGVSVVGADGTMSKAGGQVVKNVTGYDLNRLYIGSLGTLAVITEATFKIAPAPMAWAAIVAAFENNQTAVAACRNLLSQPFAPQALHVLSPPAARRLGDSNIPVGYGPVAVALIAGRPASVKRRVEDTALVWLDAASALHIAGEEATQLIELLADFPINPADPPSVCVRMNTSPYALDNLLAMDHHEIGGEAPGVVADAGFGGGRLMWWGDFSSQDAAQVAEPLRQVQSTVASLGGDAIVEACPQAAKELIDVWGPAPSGIGIMRRIKEQFDPNNLLNPGRFIGGL